MGTTQLGILAAFKKMLNVTYSSFSSFDEVILQDLQAINLISLM